MISNIYALKHKNLKFPALFWAPFYIKNSNNHMKNKLSVYK